MLGIVVGKCAWLAQSFLTAPYFKLYRFPLLCFGTFISSIQDSVHYISIIKGLFRLTTFFHAFKHIHKHMVVTQFVYLIPYREQPTAVAFCFFGYISGAFAGSEHFEAGTQETIYPDSAFCTHYFVAQVKPATECPAHFKLGNGAVLIFYQPYRMVFGIYWLYLRICPAHYFHRLYVFTNI